MGSNPARNQDIFVEKVNLTFGFQFTLVNYFFYGRTYSPLNFKFDAAMILFSIRLFWFCSPVLCTSYIAQVNRTKIT